MYYRKLLLLALTLYAYGVNSEFELTIVHTNDVHGRVEEFSEKIGSCTDNLSRVCFGGVARRYSALQQIRRKDKNVLLLDAGDQYTGTLWFDYYKGDEAWTFMNLMKYDAMTLGNHEFDNGPDGLHPFIAKAAFPVVTANVDFTRQPGWPSELKFHLKSTVLKVNGTNIGVIGFVAPETKWLSPTGPYVMFSPIIPAVRKEVQKLKKQGINILIALGHGGFCAEKEVAKKIVDIDIVVGGHSNTFLYTGTPPSNEIPEGPYPYVVLGKTKRLVVQDYAYGKYLGYLKVKFNDNGEVKSWRGNPILLNASIPQNKNILSKVKNMSTPVVAKRLLGVGYTLVPLDGSRYSCRVRECNLGNLIADAIAEMNNLALGLWNSGSIRASIVKKDAKVAITSEELYQVSPFANTADQITIRGRILREVFEHSVSGLDERLGMFLQVSGFRVRYNASKSVGNRVVRLQALCSPCDVSTYHDVDDDKLYKVVTSSYIIDGYDGFHMLKHHESRRSGEDVLTLLESYIRLKSPVSPQIEGRIQFDGNEQPSTQD